MTTPQDLLRTLAERGRSRGAHEVFAAASSGTSGPPRVAMLAAAALAVVALVAAVVSFDDDGPVIAAPERATNTTAAPPTSGAPAPADDVTASGPTTTDPAHDGGDPVVPTAGGTAVLTTLQSHGSCDSVLDRLRELGLGAVGPHGFESERPGTIDVATPESAAASDASAGPKASHSGSNIQEAGIDEPDLAKTDGDILVTMGRGRLQLVSVADRSLRSSLELPHGPGPLLLVDDTVVVLGDPSWEGEREGGPETPITMVDISDPSEPTVRATTWIEGVVRTARLHQGTVVLISGDDPRFVWAHPSEDSPAAEEAAERENRRRIEESTLGTWLPDYRIVDPSGRTVDSGPVSACDTTYTPSKESGFQTTTVSTLDPDSGRLDAGASVAASPMVVYASTASLYVVSTSCCPATPAQMHADVHRFDLSDLSAIRYAASGAVRGVPVDQFALSERGGHLRIATTYLEQSTGDSDDRTGRRMDTDSAVWVLAETDGALQSVGSITGLGKEGETIQSVRYHAQLAYVVTFRRTDPLYVVDLSDPTEPLLRGELHVPGFSSFLQHVGADRLVGIGQDADEDGRTTGLALSLFDVANPAAPARSDVLTYPGGRSLAEHDHLAMLHWAPEDLLVVPFFELDGDHCDAFSGALVVQLEGRSLTEVGRVSHAHHAQSRENTMALVPILRSAVADGHLLTVSDVGVAFGSLRDGQEQAFVDFDGPEATQEIECRSQPPSEPPPEEPDPILPL